MFAPAWQTATRDHRPAAARHARIRRASNAEGRRPSPQRGPEWSAVHRGPRKWMTGLIPEHQGRDGRSPPNQPGLVQTGGPRLVDENKVWRWGSQAAPMTPIVAGQAETLKAPRRTLGGGRERRKPEPARGPRSKDVAVHRNRRVLVVGQDSKTTRALPAGAHVDGVLRISCQAQKGTLGTFATASLLTGPGLVNTSTSAQELARCSTRGICGSAGRSRRERLRPPFPAWRERLRMPKGFDGKEDFCPKVVGSAGRLFKAGRWFFATGCTGIARKKTWQRGTVRRAGARGTPAWTRQPGRSGGGENIGGGGGGRPCSENAGRNGALAGQLARGGGWPKTKNETGLKGGGKEVVKLHYDRGLSLQGRKTAGEGLLGHSPPAPVKKLTGLRRRAGRTAPNIG